MRPLEGRVALVTGSTSGIGLGVADAFAREGVDIMLNGFGDAELVARVKDQVQGHGVRVGYSSADMSKPKQIAALVSDTAKQLGSLDILVNNAGIQYVAPIEEFPPDKWDALIAINLSSSFHAIRHALPLMKRKGWSLPPRKRPTWQRSTAWWA